MLLGQISYLDCVVFLTILAPQLLIRINTIELFVCVLRALPFFCKSTSLLRFFVLMLGKC